MKSVNRHRNPIRRGAVLNILVASVAAAAVLATIVLNVPGVGAGAWGWHRMRQPAPLSNNELEVSLMRVGLNPDTLAAAGVSAAQTTALVGRVRSALSGTIGDLRSADSGLRAAKPAFERLQRTVVAGKASAEDLSAYETAWTTHQTATSTRQTRLDAIVTAATSQGVDAGPISILANIRANSSWEVPLQYQCVTRTEAQWVALRQALANVRIAGETGGDPDTGAQQIVQAADADQTVIAAKAAHDANLTDVTAAWNAAIRP